MRILSKIIAIIVFGILGGIVASPLAAIFVDDGTSNYVFLGVFLVIALAALFAPTGRRAWGRGSLIVGALFIAMPLFMTGLSAKVGSDMISETSETDGAATAIGATLGGGLMVGASMFIGFILGAIFLILGLVLILGGRREVIVVRDTTRE